MHRFWFLVVSVQQRQRALEITIVSRMHSGITRRARINITTMKRWHQARSTGPFSSATMSGDVWKQKLLKTSSPVNEPMPPTNAFFATLLASLWSGVTDRQAMPPPQTSSLHHCCYMHPGGPSTQASQMREIVVAGCEKLVNEFLANLMSSPPTWSFFCFLPLTTLLLSFMHQFWFPKRSCSSYAVVLSFCMHICHLWALKEFIDVFCFPLFSSTMLFAKSGCGCCNQTSTTGSTWLSIHNVMANHTI